MQTKENSTSLVSRRPTINLNLLHSKHAIVEHESEFTPKKGRRINVIDNSPGLDSQISHSMIDDTLALDSRYDRYSPKKRNKFAFHTF